MTGPSQPVLATRRAVRAALADLNRDELVVVACSGGADSLALAAALAHVAPRQGLRAGAVTVDHGLQAGSADRAERVAAALGGLGLDPVEAVRVEVAGGAGPEDAARRARYAALETMADRLGAAAVVLGHTRDDQAETVLLRLARGSGTRSLAGMPAVSGRYRRPFLGLPRSVVRAAASAAGLEVWDDPHNADPAYLRPRVRHQALPAVEAALGPGVVAALARSADLVRADADALDSWADEVGAGVLGAGGVVDAQALSRWPQAVRTRVLRRFVVDGGCPAGELNAGHLLAVDALVSRWRGQGEVALPGGVWVRRDCGRLLLRRALGTASRQETRER